MFLFLSKPVYIALVLLFLKIAQKGLYAGSRFTILVCLSKPLSDRFCFTYSSTMMAMTNSQALQSVTQGGLRSSLTICWGFIYSPKTNGQWLEESRGIPQLGSWCSCIRIYATLRCAVLVLSVGTAPPQVCHQNYLITF